MAETRQSIGIIVEKGSDFDSPIFKIAIKDKVLEVDAESLPLNLGDWVSSRSKDFKECSPTTRTPLKTRVVNEQVQVLSYVAIPLGHCSVRDEFLLPNCAKVWSPHLGYAYSEPETMFGLKEEVLYEAWFEYRSDRCDDEPIWELKQVGLINTDPAESILLKQTPWKRFSKRVEMGDTSASHLLNTDRYASDGYHLGIIIAMIGGRDPEVFIYSRSNGGIISTHAKKSNRSVYESLEVGKLVKFRECEDSQTMKKYADIKEMVHTTFPDIQFEVKFERQVLSYKTIKMLAAIDIDEDLLEEGEGTMNLLCEYGRVTVSKEKFNRQMEAVFMDRDDLVEAKSNGQQLKVWIVFVPVHSCWNLDKIDGKWFTERKEESSITQ